MVKNVKLIVYFRFMFYFLLELTDDFSTNNYKKKCPNWNLNVEYINRKILIY